ncbi:MAG: hypothetical protein AAGC70_19535 [Pseudomonadota bacterium]
MSIAHIEALRSKLVASHWVVVDERDVDEYNVGVYWSIARPNGDSPLTLAFGGDPDLPEIKLEDCMGCHVVEHPEVDLAFVRIKRTWPTELDQFMRALNQLG